MDLDKWAWLRKLFLRLLIGRFILVGSAIYPGYTCWITIIFGKLKYGSLKINILPLNYCYSHRKRLTKWRQRFVKNGFKRSLTRFFIQKLKFCTFWAVRFGSNFSSMYSPNTYQIMYGETLYFQC